LYCRQLQDGDQNDWCLPKQYRQALSEEGPMKYGSHPGRVRIGIVGCGVVATAYYLPYIRKMPDAELVAVCDTDPIRTEACVRLFGAKETYTDYYEMIAKSDIDLVMILTGPGTHAPFSLAAAQAGKHLLIQKPMALTITDANKIADAVRTHNVKCLVEPSSDSPLLPELAMLRSILDRGVVGAPYWFSLIPGVPTNYSPSLGGNPYGLAAFYSEDSGGMLFDFPYAPSRIVTLLGDCRRVTGMAKISVPNRSIVPDSEYNKFLQNATDPDDCNYWDVVLDLPRTQKVTMGAPDNVYCLYEMDSGAIGVFHIGRAFHPVLPGTGGHGLEIYGTDGNYVSGGGHGGSIITRRRDLLPEADEDGWWHMPKKPETPGPKVPYKWPKPSPGSFNYYHESTRHIVDCILQNREPLLNVDWGRHITEMMYGALESSRTGKRYDMTSTTRGLRRTPAGD
jgi:predicted dehydrogenase